MYTQTHTHATVLQLSGLCPGQPGWASSRRNIHPLTSIVLIDTRRYLLLLLCSACQPTGTTDLHVIGVHMWT